VISGRTACDYVDMFADFVEGCGLSPKELVRYLKLHKQYPLIHF
jgi:hypothetical protein